MNKIYLLGTSSITFLAIARMIDSNLLMLLSIIYAAFAVYKMIKAK